VDEEGQLAYMRIAPPRREANRWPSSAGAQRGPRADEGCERPAETRVARGSSDREELTLYLAGVSTDDRDVEGVILSRGLARIVGDHLNVVRVVADRADGSLRGAAAGTRTDHSASIGIACAPR
jgi:hypothetical protein